MIETPKILQSTYLNGLLAWQQDTTLTCTCLIIVSSVYAFIDYL